VEHSCELAMRIETLFHFLCELKFEGDAQAGGPGPVCVD
jgi:hypothetical protein